MANILPGWGGDFGYRARGKTQDSKLRIPLCETLRFFANLSGTAITRSYAEKRRVSQSINITQYLESSFSLPTKKRHLKNQMPFKIPLK